MLLSWIVSWFWTFWVCPLFPLLFCFHRSPKCSPIFHFIPTVVLGVVTITYFLMASDLGWTLTCSELHSCQTHQIWVQCHSFIVVSFSYSYPGMFGTSNGSSTSPAAPYPLDLHPCVHPLCPHHPLLLLVVCCPGPGWRIDCLFVQVGLVRICSAWSFLHLVCHSLSCM